MSDRYKGGILSGTAPTVTPQSANGVYTTSQQYQYQGQGVWPTAAQNPILQSLRFRSSASASLSRTPAVTGNQKTMTLSFWTKRGTLSTYSDFLNSGSASSNFFYTGFGNGDSLNLQCFTGSTQVVNMTTTAVFRDPSAWYHIVYSIDMTQASSSNGLRLWVNGVQQSLTITFYVQNSNLYVNNSGIIHYFGRASLSSSEYFDGEMTEVNFIDGQALTPSSFGTTDANGIWQPISYTGTYGTNGFYLPFSDKSALTTSSNVGLGKDFSGNGNYWTTNNISITAGSTYDSMTDVPTLTSATTANYAVLNPLTTKIDLLGVATLSNGNLQATSGGSNAMLCIGSIFITSGKWYAECTVTTSLSDYIGLASQTNANSTASGTGAYSYTNAGTKASNGSSSAYGATYTTGDVIGVAYDADAGTLTFYKNGTSQGTAYSGIDVSVPRTFASFNAGTGTYVHNWNFGQRPFSYTPPTGFVALNTYNLPVPTIPAGNKQMDATLWTGTGVAQNIVNSGSMQPDFVWIKARNQTYDNQVWDSVRGALLKLSTNQTAAESSLANSVTGFNSNGIALGDTATVNLNTGTFVGWQWQAGKGVTSSNTQGTITSTVSANTTAGFSVVTWTGTGSAATVGHGLGVAPSMIIAKSRSTVANWQVYHSSISNMATGFIMINSTAAFSTATSQIWNSTAPTSTVFSLGTDTDINGSANTIVAYCFAQITGYSAFGIYTGNGSADGPFVYLGFRPKFVMIKRTDGIGNWSIYDTSRDPYNVMTQVIFGNLSDAESNNTATVDYLSNGFKLRIATFQPNTSGATFIYMAFAENPFKMARAR